MKPLIKNNTLILFFSIFFSYVFVFEVPWSNIVYFVDIDFYLERIGVLLLSGIEGAVTKDYTGVGLLSSELLWYLILLQIPIFFTDFNLGLELISFISLLIYSYFTFKNSNLFLSSILLYNPIFIDLIMSQIRIAFAFALLIIAYSLRKQYWFISLLLLISSSLIHTATYFLFFVYIFISLISKKIQNENKLHSLMLITPTFFVLFIKFLLLPLLDFFRDTGRVGYFIGEVDSSTLLFSSIYLFFALLIAFLPKRNDSKVHFDATNYIIFMCSLFFSLSLVQMYGSRFVAISFPFLIIAINNLKLNGRLILYSLLFSYQLIYIYYWLSFS